MKAAIAFSGNPCGGHTLDNLLYLLSDPDPVSVRATLGTLSPFEGDTANMRFKPDAQIQSAHVEFANGTAIHINGVGASGEYEVICERGILRIPNDGYTFYARRADPHARGYDEMDPPSVERWSSGVAKVQDPRRIRPPRPAPASANLRATLISQGDRLRDVRVAPRGGVRVDVPITENRDRWVSSW